METQAFASFVFLYPCSYLHAISNSAHLSMTLKELYDKMTSRYLWGNILAMILVIALIIFLTLKGLDIYSRHGEEVTVPRLKGMTYDEARKSLEAVGLVCVVADSGYVPRYAAGTVLDQGIEPGMKVKAGREVSLTVNASSPPTIVMLDLADNSSLREAQSRLEALGFKLTPPEYINGEKEWVYGVKSNGKNVVAGTRVSVTSVLTLVVGNGLTDDDMSEEYSLETEWEYGEEINFDENSNDGGILAE